MAEVGKFLVKDTFNITHRGIVLLGQILEGDICKGNHISINQDTQFKILGLDFPRSQSIPLQLGLSIGNVIQKADLEAIKNQILIITD